jgi:hypothetical protein
MNKNPFLLNIDDKNDYTLEDYICIQDQLNNKNIDNILIEYYPPKNKFYEFDDFKNRCCKGLTQQLIDTTLPTKKIYKFGNYENSKNCIVCCTPISNKQDNTRLLASQEIIKSLENVGYNGYFYLLNGGFPNPNGIEMKYAGVPYCFKIFMMLEAQKIGFDKVIWIDSGCYCINNPDRLFDILENQETIIKTIPYGNNYDGMVFSQTIDLLNSLTGSFNYASLIAILTFEVNSTVLPLPVSNPAVLRARRSLS